MNSNYRLPLKHFEKQNWEDKKNYKSNIRKLKLWPLLSLAMLGLLIIGGLYLTFNSNKINTLDIVITPSTNGQVLVNNCEFQFSAEESNKYIWKNDKCNNQLVFEISNIKTPNSTLISESPTYYLKNINNIKTNITNSNLLLDKVIVNNPAYFEAKTKPLEFSKLATRGNCTTGQKCELIRIIDNNKAEVLNTKILETLLVNKTLKPLQLVEVDNEVFIQTYFEQYSNRYKLDLAANTIIKQ